MRAASFSDEPEALACQNSATSLAGITLAVPISSCYRNTDLLLSGSQLEQVLHAGKRHRHPSPDPCHKACDTRKGDNDRKRVSTPMHNCQAVSLTN